jgi:hypothetical protein
MCGSSQHFVATADSNGYDGLVLSASTNQAGKQKGQKDAKEQKRIFLLFFVPFCPFCFLKRP